MRDVSEISASTSQTNPSLLSNEHFIRNEPCETMNLPIEWTINCRQGSKLPWEAVARR